MLENNQPVIPSLASTLTDSGSIDWDLIQTIDPISLRSPNGIESMKLIAQQFLQATTVPLGNPALILKLLQVLQVIIGYLCTSYDDFTELIKQKELENHNLKEILENETQNIIIGAQCPACNKVFKSAFFLDKHIIKSHPNIASLWQSLRMPYAINQTQLYTNFFPSEPVKSTPNAESEDIQKTLKEIKKELRHHNEKKHLQKKIENRISNVENQIVKLTSTISEPLLHYQAQMQSHPQQQPVIIQQPAVPQVVLQTIPVQRQVEIDPKASTTTNNKFDDELDRKKNIPHHHSHHKHKSHKVPSQQNLVEQATSPFLKPPSPNNFLDSDDSYNKNSDSILENDQIPVQDNVITNKNEAPVVNINENPTKEKENTQNNTKNNIIDKPNLNDNKAKKKIKKKIKPTIEPNSLKPFLNQNSNPNQQQKQNQDQKNIIQNNHPNINYNANNSYKPKTKDQNNMQKPIPNQVPKAQINNNPKNSDIETKNSNSKPNFGIIWKPPPNRTKNIIPDTNDDKNKEEPEEEIVIGIVKRNDYSSNTNSLNNVPKQGNVNISMNHQNITNGYTESEQEVSIPVRNNALVSPQNTFSTNQNNVEDDIDEDDNDLPRPFIQATTIKCVKSMPNQQPNCRLSPSSMASIPSISSDFGSPYVKKHKSLLQDMSSESDSKAPLVFHDIKK